MIVFPDVNQYQYWKIKADSIKQQLQMDINVSDFMEVNASDTMKMNGADLADVLIKRDVDTGIALTDGVLSVGMDVAKATKRCWRKWCSTVSTH